MRVPPVTFVVIHRRRSSRSSRFRASPSRKARRLPAIARGVLVSRMSPGTPSLISVSYRSISVTSSPRSSSTFSRPSGPPSSRSSRLTAVLSLYQRVAAHSPRRLMPVSTKFSETGEFSTRSSREYLTTLSIPSVPNLRRTAPAASALNVEAYANRSSGR
jgi:hypothetical protein